MKGALPALDRRPELARRRRKPSPVQLEAARTAMMIRRGTSPDARIWFQIRRPDRG